MSSHFNPLLDDNLFILWVRGFLKSHPAGAAVKVLPPGSRLAMCDVKVVHQRVKHVKNEEPPPPGISLSPSPCKKSQRLCLR
ncbi:hypothetical protein, partial [Microseira sp. BLCC-F43]|uniref:hypothetical protein n=1 Tax=Microseira sp. BLCC-F43 TaxID=3153602 RepID=UPI0035B8875C